MMEELEKLQEQEDRVTGLQKKYNVTSKTAATLIGRNLTLLVCILLPLILVGFIWTEFGEMIFHKHTIIEAILTVTLFTIGEILMTQIGADGGKMDAEYLSAKDEFDCVLKKVAHMGTALMGAFCDWQVDLELAQATRFRLRLLKITPKTYNEIKNYTPSQLRAKYGKSKAKKIQAVIDLEPIELNEAILLYNGKLASRGGVPTSGDEHLQERKHYIKRLLYCFFTALLTVTVAMTLVSEITIARVIYTIFKLTMLLYRMARGYSRGANAFNTIEVKHLKARTNYLRQYVKFVEDKTYLKLIDKYEEIREVIEDDEFVGGETTNCESELSVL